MKFTYFDFGGRGFAPRVCLFKALGKDGWIDERVEYNDFLAKKAEGAYPLGSVPVLTMDDGTALPQSGAIARYTGRLAGLYPTDPIMQAKVDFAFETWNEILAKTPHAPNPDELKAKREEYAAGWMKTAMTLLNNLYSGDYLLEELTIADLGLHMIVDMIIIGEFSHVPPEYVDGFPNLKSSYAAIKASPLLKSYFENYKC